MAASNLEEAKQYIQKLQHFNVQALIRQDELGSSMSFGQAIDPAKRVIRLFQQISTDYLHDLTQSSIDTLLHESKQFYSILESIMKFTPAEVDSPSVTRQNYINQLEEAYDHIFSRLHPLISYLASRQRDFAELERQARAAVQTANDQADKLRDELEKSRIEAENILNSVRQVAAEQGVSQQAVYFKEEADRHDLNASTWRNYTIFTSVLIAILALSSIATYKIEFFTPSSAYQAIQLTLGKLLTFGTAVYLLVLCAKNFLSHKHNAIVNKHRQNALLTFNALVEASQGDDKRDIILTHAASCIFMPQDTGYTKSSAANESASTKLIEIMPRLATNS